MARLLDINWSPATRDLRLFGGVCCLALPLVSWLVLGRPSRTELSPGGVWGLAVPTILGFISLALAVVQPRWLLWPYRLLTALALPIGLVITESLLLLVFFGMFTPVALWFRFMGRDALALRPQPEESSYWRPKTQPADVRRYFRQY